MLLTDSYKQKNLSRFSTRNDNDIPRTHCDQTKNVNSSTTLRKKEKKTCSTHCQIKTQAMFDKKKKHKHGKLPHLLNSQMHMRL